MGVKISLLLTSCFLLLNDSLGHKTKSQRQNFFGLNGAYPAAVMCLDRE